MSVIKNNEEMEQMYNLYKPIMFSIAYRMLGSVMDAEDIVQEAFLRWNKNGAEHIQNTKAYLCKIVTNRCIDLLQSARKQREIYVGTWLPEPLVTETATDKDPLQSYLQKESISTAYLLLLQQLTYVERAVFLLREVLQYDYDEIADIVGKSSSNCRQIFHRAKRGLNFQQISDSQDQLEQENTCNLVEQFMHALGTGDVEQIMQFLSNDATLFMDGGGKTKALPVPLQGKKGISQFVAGFSKKTHGSITFRLAMVNGQPGIVAYMNKKIFSVTSFQIESNRIVSGYMVVNPDKLKHLL